MKTYIFILSWGERVESFFMRDCASLAVGCERLFPILKKMDPEYWKGSWHDLQAAMTVAEQGYYMTDSIQEIGVEAELKYVRIEEDPLQGEREPRYGWQMWENGVPTSPIFASKGDYDHWKKTGAFN
jgi:hypothetical protein